MENIDPNELASLGIDPAAIAIHKRRILSQLHHSGQATLAVKDTCRLDNGGIVAFETLEAASRALGSDEKPEGFVAFIPAAGAASRYFKTLTPLANALQDEDRKALAEAIEDLRQQGAESWPLPTILKKSFDGDKGVSYALEHRLSLLAELAKAKALQPAVTSGESFLYMKNIEHQAIQGLCGQVFVVPKGQSKEFAEEFEQLPSRKGLATFFLEQGPELSTIRFKENGEAFRDENGQLSTVPAGHGTLVRLIPEVKRLQEKAHSLFIRNIDNVMGTQAESLKASETFLRAHQFLLSRIKEIRSGIAQQNLSSAHPSAKAILKAYQFDAALSDEVPSFFGQRDAETAPLWQVLLGVLNCSPEFATSCIASYQSEEKALEHLYSRPVNSLGQVPNSGKDVGGTPVFTEAFGVPLTMCLEVPHASPEDQKAFLANPAKATHFNPVFVASELLSTSACYELEDSPFWILARKTLGSSEVVYHETVLYELLGNSMLANVVFTEIPRLLFHPHKTMADGQGKVINDWLSS